MWSHRHTPGILFAIILSWTLTPPVEAAPQAFVSVTGDDDTACGPAWPCRTLATALAVVDNGGEVVVLSSGHYEPFSIGKSVSVIALPGVYAGITAASGNAINIDAGGDGVVTLRGLTLIGRGAETGINIVQVGSGSVHIEDCTLKGFSGNAIAFVRRIPDVFRPYLYIKNTIVKDSGSDYASAIYVSVTGLVSIDGLRMEGNRHGLVVDSGKITIRDSIATRQIVHAVWARALNDPADITIENCTITGTAALGGNQGSAVIAGDRAEPHNWAKISVSNSTIAANNGRGIAAFPPTNTSSYPTKVFVSNTTITSNVQGIEYSAPANVLTRGNNTLDGNVYDGNFSGGFSAK